MNAERLLDDEDRTWRELLGVLARISPQDLERPRLPPDGWSAKDAMFHIAAWMSDCAEQLERMRTGTFEDRVDTIEDIDRMNREWFETSRTMDLATVRTALMAARRRMLRAWTALPEVTPIAWEWFEETGPIHYRKHLDDLRALATGEAAGVPRSDGVPGVG